MRQFTIGMNGCDQVPLQNLTELSSAAKLARNLIARDWYQLTQPLMDQIRDLIHGQPLEEMLELQG